MARFAQEQLERYSRHILLPQVGGRGQQKLLDSRVFVVGAGGLGSPVILYLAAAGVGTIEVVDDDVVDLGNLQRQIAHGTSRIGVEKVESARQTVADLNPDVKFIAHATRLNAENIRGLIANADIVVDGSDNFPTRYLVNDACWMERKPLVSGAILQFEGQITVLPNDHGADSPCYRCLFSEAPPPGAVPSCAEAGVFGAIAGIIGSLQAAEVIKLLLGIGDSLAGRLVMFDALATRMREVRLHRDCNCALCGDAPSITTLTMLDDTNACRRTG